MILKPATKYEQQVERLEKYGFVVQDKTQLKEFLSEANYYRLSAYLLPFKLTDDRYIEGIPMKRIKRLYDFDSDLRSWICQNIEHIEYYLRTQLSYYLAHNYPPDYYMNPDMFTGEHKHEDFLNHIKRCIKNNEKTLVVKHHKAKYKGRFPIWVIIESFTTRMLSILYADLQRPLKKAIARDAFNTTDRNLESWLRVFTELRNICAHYGRLYFRIFVSIPRAITKSDKAIDDKLRRSLFFQIMTLKRLYPNQIIWDSHRLPQLKRIMNEYSDSIELDHIGFPSNWFELLTHGQ